MLTMMVLLRMRRDDGTDIRVRDDNHIICTTDTTASVSANSI